MRWRKLALGLGLTLVLAACGGSAGGGSGAQQAAPTKVQVGILGSASDSGIILADAFGYFKQQRITLSYQRFQSGANMTAPIGTGQLDVAAGAPSAGLFNAMARDIQIKIVADKGDADPGHGFEVYLVRKQLWDSGQVRTVADLKGRKIAQAATGIPPEYELDTLLHTAGLSIKDVSIVPLAFPDMVTGLQNGSIDGAGVIEPFGTLALSQNAGVILRRNDQIVPGNQLAVIMYSSAFAGQTDLARRWMVAYLKGVRDYNDIFIKKTAPKSKHDAAVQALIKDTSVTNAALWDKMVMPGLDPNGKMRVNTISDFQEWAVKNGFQKQPIDLGKVVDTSFANYAVKQLGPYR